jgi:enolase-phosphatase E1
VNPARHPDGVAAVLLDIEGTTTPIAFVYQTLFPYVRAHLARYLDEHAATPPMASIIDRLERERAADPDAPPAGPIAGYLEWLMDRDRKSTPLKDLQGRMWEAGYRRGELIGDIFGDVPRALTRWHDEGIGVGIFSSGSVLAQRLLFAYSTSGDLTSLIRWYFDTTVGPKREAASYRRIADEMTIAPGSILFVSDVVPELDAAHDAGMQTRLSIRPGNAAQPEGHAHQIIRDFDELQLAGRPS